MSQSTYNHAEILDFAAFMETNNAEIEETAHQLLTLSGVVADNTSGAAADAHAETAHHADQISQKGREVVAELRTHTMNAQETAQGHDGDGMQALTGGF